MKCIEVIPDTKRDQYIVDKRKRQRNIYVTQFVDNFNGRLVFLFNKIEIVDILVHRNGKYYVPYCQIENIISKWLFVDGMQEKAISIALENLKRSVKK